MNMLKVKKGDNLVVKNIDNLDSSILSRLYDLGFKINSKIKVLRCLKNNIAIIVLCNGRQIILSKEVLLSVEVIYV